MAGPLLPSSAQLQLAYNGNEQSGSVKLHKSVNAQFGVGKPQVRTLMHGALSLAVSQEECPLCSLNRTHFGALHRVRLVPTPEVIPS